MAVIEVITSDREDEQDVQQQQKQWKEEKTTSAAPKPPPSSDKLLSNNDSNSKNAYSNTAPRIPAPLKKYVVEVVIPTSVVKPKPKPPQPNGTALTVKVNGKTFTTKAGFDTFWEYASERNLVEENRRSGKPQPWSKKRVFQEYKFCSVFRVADRGSQFLIAEVIEKGSQEEEEVLFRVLLYSSFVRVETYQLLERRLGLLTWKTYDRQKYSDVLVQALRKGQAIFTGAFQKHGPKFGYAHTHENHLVLLETMMNDNLLQQLKECRYMADAFDVIYKYPGSGDFTGFQLLINLSYSSLVNFNEDDFVVAGLGAVEGLEKCFDPPESIRGSEPELIRWMTDTQEEHFVRLGLVPATLGKEKRRMTLVDMEHTLCELQKYIRLVSSDSSGSSSKKTANAKQRFNPKTQNLPRWPTLPTAWSHPARENVKVKPGRKGTHRAKKVYVVNKILDRGEADDGEVMYFVDWLGYGEKDRSWEPAGSLLVDAPKMVEEYERLHPRRDEDDEDDDEDDEDDEDDDYDNDGSEEDSDDVDSEGPERKKRKV